MGRKVIARNVYMPMRSNPFMGQQGNEGAAPFWVQTLVNGAQVGVTTVNVTANGANGLIVGNQVAIGGLGTKTLTGVTASTISFAGAITTAGGEVITKISGTSEPPIGRRLVMPRSGFIKGYFIEFNGVLTGTGATFDLNAGIFRANYDTVGTPDIYASPYDLIPGCEGACQITSANFGSSSRRALDCYFTAPGNGSWQPAGTPLWLMGLYRLTGTVTAGGINEVGTLEPRVQVNQTAIAHRSNVRGTTVQAYSAATLASLVSTIGAYPGNYTTVAGAQGDMRGMANMHVGLIIDLTE